MNIKTFNQAINSAIKKMAEYSKKVNYKTVEITVTNHVFLTYEDDDVQMKICLEIFDDEIIELYFDLNED
jgi:hypothetical protein